MKTVFHVSGENYVVEGVGQQAADTIVKEFPRARIILYGFMIHDKFVPSPWFVNPKK